MEAVIRINSLVDIEDLKGPWNELLMSSGADRLFLSWEWIFTWCKHRSNEQDLFLLLVKEEGILVAIAPFVISQARFKRLKLLRTLRFMATDVVGSDYMDILVSKGREKSAVEAIVGYLKHNCMSLELSHLCAGQTNARMLANKLNESHWNIVRKEIEVCPYVNLQCHSWDSYLKSRGASHRANIKRKIRKVYARFAVNFSSVEDDLGLDCAFDQMLILHYKRHGDSRISDAFNEDSVLLFHKELAQLSLNAACLRLYTMELDNKPVAALYGFLVDGKFYFYQSGFDPEYAEYSVGLILLAHAIEQAISEGAYEFDLLHGNERYKYLWTNDQRTLERLYCFPPTLSGMVSKHCLLIKKWLKNNALGIVK